MTDAPDYGELWTVSEDCDVRDSGGYLIWSQRQSPFVFKKQIHRAIACVNACRGIPNPEDAALGIKSVYDDFNVMAIEPKREGE